VEWSEYVQWESELGRGEKAQQLIDYQLGRTLTR
jgi:hypothetical protein